MKIVIFDPSYSDVGHHQRYNRMILTLLSDMVDVEKIIYVSNKEEGIDFERISNKITNIEKFSEIKNKTKIDYEVIGLFHRWLHFLLMYFAKFKHYINVNRYINKLDCDFVFFTYNGHAPFWASSFILKKKFIISTISIKWIYDSKSYRFFLYLFYKWFICKAKLIIVTEEIYKNTLLNNGIRNVNLLYDRYLVNNDTNRNTQTRKAMTINLLTIGTMAYTKNPLNFVRLLQKCKNSKYKYEIYGKSFDGVAEDLYRQIENDKCITYHSGYIEENIYHAAFEVSDFIVIPYENSYTKHSTSGVMHDCFEKNKPILCPDIEPFRSYIKKYRIGLLYTNETLEEIMVCLTISGFEIAQYLVANYVNLQKVHSYENAKSSLNKIIKSI